jgi:O-antigen ligase
VLNVIYLGLLVAAFFCVHALVGGTTLLFALCAYAIVAVASVLCVFSGSRVRVPANATCLFASGIFFGYVLLRAAFSPVSYLARPDMYMVVASLAVYLLVAFHLTNPRHRMIFLGVLMLLTQLNVLVGAWQFAQDNNFMLLFGRPDYEARASGLFVCPNHLAGFLEVMAVFSMSVLCWSRWKLFGRLLALYTAVMATVGIVLTGSRGGYLSTVFAMAAFAGLTIYVVRRVVPQRFTLVIGLWLTFFIGAFVIAHYAVSSPYLKARAQHIASHDSRVHLWNAALNQFALSPLFGTGSGTYVYYGRTFRHPSVQTDPIHVHGDYLELLAEYGIVGFAAFLFFIISHARNGLFSTSWIAEKRLQNTDITPWTWLVTRQIESFNKTKSHSLALIIGALSAVAAYVIHSIFDFNLHIPANSMLMAFVFGMLANPGIETGRQSKLAWKITSARRFVLPALGLWLMLFALPKLPGEFFAYQAAEHLGREDFVDAIESGNRALQWGKRNPDLYYVMGEAKRSIAQQTTGEDRKAWYTQATEDFAKGLALFPQDTRLLLIQGWTLDALSDFGESEKAFKTALTWDPKSAQVHAYYGAHLDLQGRLEEARAAYQNALKLSPDDPVASEGLKQLTAEIAAPPVEKKLQVPN